MLRRRQTGRSVTINQIYYNAVKVYSEATGYTQASIVETALEQFFPDVDFEELLNSSEVDNTDQIVYNENNQT